MCTHTDYARAHWQPVQLLKYWSDMAKRTRAVNEPSTNVHYALQPGYDFVG